MCELYDELNQCCALERMEKIAQTEYRDDKPVWELMVRMNGIKAASRLYMDGWRNR